jgi:hypothetical protein
VNQADTQAPPARGRGRARTYTAAGFDLLYVQRPRRWLLVILAAYLLCASLYVVVTPAWQAPDEPAHYNYIIHIASTVSLPTLQLGDYNEETTARLLAAGFDPDTDIETLRYESYQPPLYYLTAAVVSWASGDSLRALRFYNVFLGLVSLLLLYLALETVFPNKPLILLGATAFAALLPMHVAVTAALNNDVMAEMLMMGSALVLFRWMRPYYGGAAIAANPWRLLTPSASRHHDRRHLLLLGVLLGLGMLTKIYAYAVLPMFAAIVMWTVWREQRTRAAFGRGLLRLLLLIAPALLLAAPLWVRNVMTYGRWDLLALQWHDQVVAGQPTTQAWIAAHGSLDYFERAFNLTFRSFWGVFGWMGVVMDERIYMAALFFTGVLFLGLLWASMRLISGPPDTDMDDFQTTVIVTLGLLLTAVLASFVWYNLKFVQHQGRYFFWGMLAIGTVVALGWREVLHPLQGTITGLIAAVLASSLLLGSLLGGRDVLIGKWTLATAAAIALFLLLQPLLLVGTEYTYPLRTIDAGLEPLAERGVMPQLLQGARFLAWAAPFLLLFVLNLLVPFWYIGPQLAR